MNTIIPVENHDVLAALRGFLKRLLDEKIVEALLVPLQSGGSVSPALVTNSAILESANPLMPLMPINAARAVSALTGKHSPTKLGAVLRACEIRALVELVKLQQASLDDVTLIGMDCPGTYELDEFLDIEGEGNCTANFAEYLTATTEGREPNINGLKLRIACQMCVRPAPENVDIHIHLFGADTTVVLPITVKDEIAEKLHLTEAVQVEAWSAESSRKATEKIIAGRQQFREKELTFIRAKMNLDGGVAGMFSSCIRCHNCMTACPVCYCKTCLFKTAAFDHEPEYYLNAAHRKGATRMLGDTLLFQLTRMNHMSASCVSCGACTSACPVNIPVGSIFSAVGEKVQSAFEYEPGHAGSEPLPLITFHPNEWTEIGEDK